MPVPAAWASSTGDSVDGVYRRATAAPELSGGASLTPLPPATSDTRVRPMQAVPKFPRAESEGHGPTAGDTQVLAQAPAEGTASLTSCTLENGCRR